jgi:hypothetical protein
MKGVSDAQKKIAPVESGRQATADSSHTPHPSPIDDALFKPAAQAACLLRCMAEMLNSKCTTIERRAPPQTCSKSKLFHRS